MNILSRRLGAVFLGLACLPAAALAQELPTFSLLAVKINPECVGGANAGAPCLLDSACSSNDCGGDIVPSANISAFPGDLIVVDLFASNWSPNGEQLRGYKASIDRDSFTSGTDGELMLLDAPRPCTKGGTECDDLGSNIACVGGFCEIPPVNPESVDIDIFRPDWIYNGWAGTFAVVGSYGVGLGAHRTNANGPVYSAAEGPRYAGTFRLVASDDACGLFRLMVNPPTDSAFFDQNNIPIQPINLEELVIDLAARDCRIVESDPPNCSIDARQPSEPDGSGVASAKFVDYRFNGGCITTDLTWLLSRFSAGPSVEVGSLLYNPDGRGPDWVRATFANGLSMPLAEWTCVTIDLLATAPQVFCHNRLPADVNQNGTSRVLDLRRMTDVCLPQGICDPLECDVDRSGVCAPRDLLRVVDLLNGAATYDVWELASVSSCPSP